jgi:hypothetical protein
MRVSLPIPVSPDDEFRRLVQLRGLKDMLKYVRERHGKDGLMPDDPMLEEVVLSLKLVEDLHLTHKRAVAPLMQLRKPQSPNSPEQFIS